ncbi:Orm1 type endoplasmic reticulum protein [Exidia glandulosa HHB12029]|uniref:Orm1 type endoplasmic reticulum protein n=1 Tax=Exidia glandulosa HHB12029 TaxID=1314781 RepID=A0A165J2J0_EXIGL|nr:Orm1 type endoplasmic reticulum protein [Exidia glandulosa HHB12029]
MSPPNIKLPDTLHSINPQIMRRGRSASIVKVEEVGENANEELDQTASLNSEWVNYKGAWLIHPVLMLMGKVFIDTVPGVNQELSWTIVNLCYLTFSYIMFHYVTGIPFGTEINGVYDDLTMWEQIDSGAQYTPAKKWLFCMPIGLFLLSTHFTRYDPILFGINFTALVVLGVLPKLPQLHRQRIRLMPEEDFSSAPTPIGPPTPKAYD